MSWRALGWIVLGVTSVGAQADDNRLTSVSLQLLWYHQFQSAGYYAAEAQGYFRDAGLDVEIRDGGYDAAGKAVDPVEEVVFQRADFGVSRSDLLIHHSRGLPVVALANIMQRSPLVFLTLERYGFSRLEDIGQRPISVTLPGHGADKRLSAETVAAFRRARVDIRMLNNSPPTWQLDDLLSGKTQLTTAYSTDAAYFVRQRGEVPLQIHPHDYGIDFYGELLFTNTQLLEKQPAVVKAFREAALKGWEYAMDHPEEIAALIIERYRTRHERYDKDFLLYEAEKIRELMQPELIEIGYSNPTRWEDITNIYRDMGLIVFDVDLFKAINDNFGHLAGDRVLIAIARITRGVLRTSDHFARYGGEEFVVLLPDTGLDEARHVAERIWQANRGHAVQYETRSIRYTLSLGVAELSPTDISAQAFFKRADTLLYQAKGEGRDRLCLEVV